MANSSLLDLYNVGMGREPVGGDYGPRDPKLIDRMSMLPIGQYDDNSLTLAWPQMAIDAYEGAVRSFEEGRQLPRVDSEGYYAGTPRAEPLDAFNAASIAPMAGVGARAAGMARGAESAAVRDLTAMPGYTPPDLGTEGPLRLWHTSGAEFDKFDPAFSGSNQTGTGHAMYPGAFSFSPKAEFSGPGGSWGQLEYARKGKPHHVYEVEVNADRNMLPDLSRPLREQPHGVQDVVAQNPILQSYFENSQGKYSPPSEMYRAFNTVMDHDGSEIVVSDPSLINIISRNGQRLAANDSNAAVPSLALNAMDGDDFAFQTLVRAFGGDETKARNYQAAMAAPTGAGVRPRDSEIFSWPVRAATRIGDKYYVAQTHGLAVDNGLQRLGYSRDALLDDPRVDDLLKASEDGFMINGRFLTRDEAAKAVGSPGEYIGSEHGFDLDNLENSSRPWWKLPIGRSVRDDDLVDVSETLFANPETSAYPSLLLNSEDGQQNPLLTSVDPVYDTRMLLQFMEDQRQKERKRIAPPMDPGDMQDQYSVDYPDDPQEPEPYRPLPRRPR